MPDAGETPREETPVPPSPSGRARELSRKRTTRPLLPDTGRRHHIGAAPAELSVLRDDGSVVTTRTAAVQLADQTDAQLARLGAKIEREMQQAADALDFEHAAWLREEVAAVRRELARRAAPPG
jgi:UvrB/uvrC motif